MPELKVVPKHVRCFTPSWAAERLPKGTDLVLIDGKRWWLLIWGGSDTCPECQKPIATVKASPDPEQWAEGLDIHGGSSELIPYEAPHPLISDFLRKLGEIDADE